MAQKKYFAKNSDTPGARFILGENRAVSNYEREILLSDHVVRYGNIRISGADV